MAKSTRRVFIRTSVGALALTACGGGDGTDAGGTDTGGADTGGTDTGGAGCTTSWGTIPDQVFTMGQPITPIDLADYITEGDVAALLFSLDAALPAGLTLAGSVISGTPTEIFSGPYVAIADDQGCP